MYPSTSVLDTLLRPCSHEPRTGWFRDGCCNTDASDRGSHTVCCAVTSEFLEFLRAQGNDLMTPQHSFPGLKPGDQWCVCAASWRAAYDAGVACPVVLESTHISALDYADLEMLLEHAVAAEA